MEAGRRRGAPDRTTAEKRAVRRGAAGACADARVATRAAATASTAIFTSSHFPVPVPVSAPFGEPSARRLTYSDGALPPPGSNLYAHTLNQANDYNPSISPDGTKIVFVSDCDGVPQLYLMDANGTSFPQRLTFDGCLAQVPTWSSDGRTLFLERQCTGGTFAPTRANLQYVEDSWSRVNANLIDLRELTDQTSDNRDPRVSPDGKTLVFTSYRDGNAGDLPDRRERRRAAAADQRRRRGRGADLERERQPAGLRQQPRRRLRLDAVNFDGGGYTQLTDNGVGD